MTHISASDLYSFYECPTRPGADRYRDPALRNADSAFVQMLWERGVLYESETVTKLGRVFLNLKDLPADEKLAKTTAAISAGVPLIYNGRIEVDNLVGEPDLLEKMDDGYRAGDIKSGSAFEGASEDEEGKIKRHYGVQLALYTDVLHRLGVASRTPPFILDGKGDMADYDLNQPLGPRTPSINEIYRTLLDKMRGVIAEQRIISPALSSKCKDCHWRSSCRTEIERSNDLTLIPKLGRSLRDTIQPTIARVSDLAEIDLGAFIDKRKTKFPGVGPDRLLTFQARARLLTDPAATPYLKEQIHLPKHPKEIFFDIETDPLRDIVYLHGFYEVNARDGRGTFYGFFAETDDSNSEKAAFSQAMQYLRSALPAGVYFYSKFERTQYRRLAKLYPEVAGIDEINALFSLPDWYDLLEVVDKCSEWPTTDHSIKTLAKYLGFKWRDTDPSGAASIEWYDSYLKSQDQAIKKRILEYNEDDCIATDVVLKGLRDLLLRS